MPTYVCRDGQVIDKRHAPRVPVQRSDLPTPYIRTDGMAEIWNPANGQIYDSKSGYERAVKDAGCIIVGDDAAISRPQQTEYDPSGVEQSIKDAYDQLSG